MSIEYLKDEKSIIIKSECCFIDYQVKMIRNNNLNWILNFCIKECKEWVEIKYDIINLRSLKSLKLEDDITLEKLGKIVNKIKQIKMDIEEYMLDVSNIDFNVDNIYVDRHFENIYFVYIPIEQEKTEINIDKEINGVMRYLIDIMRDSKEKSKIKLLLKNDNITISELQTDLFKEKNESMPEYEIDDKSKKIEKTINVIIALSIFIFIIVAIIYRSDVEFLKLLFIVEIIVVIICVLIKYIIYTMSLNEFEEEFEELEELKTIIMRKYPILKKNNFEKYIVDSEYYIIGKSIDADLNIAKNATVSREHAAIINRDSKYYVKDLNSINGTFVNGIKLSKSQEIILNNNDKLQFGSECFMFVF